jgi:hypothetical protein
MNRRLARLQRDPHFDDARRRLGRRHSLTTGVLLDPLSTYGRHELAAETPLTYRLTDLPIELAPVSCAAEPTAAGAWRYRATSGEQEAGRECAAGFYGVGCEDF